MPRQNSTTESATPQGPSHHDVNTLDDQFELDIDAALRVV
jgi:hypothetical protein